MSFFWKSTWLSLARRFRRPGSWVLAAMLLALTVGTILAANPGESATVRVGLVLPERGAEKLERLLLQRGGDAVEFIVTDEETANRKVLAGSWDCAIVVDKKFDRRVESLELDGIVTVVISPASTVYPLVKETVAACVMELISPDVAREFLEDSGIPAQSLDERLEEIGKTARRVDVKLRTLDGEPLSMPAMAHTGIQFALRGLVAVMSLVWGLYLTVDLGRWLETGWAGRLRTVRTTTELLLPELAAGLLPLLLWGCVVLPWLGGGLWSLPAYGGLLAVLLGIGSVIPRLPSVWRSIPVTLPFFAIGSLVLEPVLVDVSTLFPTISRVTRWLPVTLCVRGCQGSTPAIAALFALSAGLLGISRIMDRKR